MLKQRHDPKMEQNKSEAIMISEKWMEELKSLPLVNKVRNTLIVNYNVEQDIGWGAVLESGTSTYKGLNILLLD